MSDIKEVKLTGGALKQVQARRGGGRTRKMRGGEAPVGYGDDIAQASAIKAASLTSTALKSFGPELIQGGLQKGGNGPQDMANATSVAANALKNFGPDAIQKTSPQMGGTGAGISTSISSTTAPGNASSVVPYNSTTPSTQAPAVIAGGSHVRLAPPKQRTKITLKAPKKHAMKAHKDASTKKIRKIALRTRGVTSRLAKAKRASHDAQKAPISLIKTRLEKYGVIKKGSKAPEPMLRTMYADLLITKKGL